MTLFLTYELTFCDSFLDTWQVGFYCLVSLLIFYISDSFIKCLIFPYEVPHCTRSFGPIYFSYISIKYIWSYSFLSPNFSQIFPHPFLLIFIFLSINKTKQNKAKTTHTHTPSKPTNKLWSLLFCLWTFFAGLFLAYLGSMNLPTSPGITLSWWGIKVIDLDSAESQVASSTFTQLWPNL